ncbi:hypothetical protein [Clostridium senegalense]|uniref:Mor transcription activator domain-containing protein n=1 Tax=Clostridium senegalense TaxID=1465809 RepID=A0A6M0H547_9CLOT|nr:hypothetical protein [Clostridium senegalense]NEU04991.1 hypothetical protein [Clostridium senegalense]
MEQEITLRKGIMKLKKYTYGTKISELASEYFLSEQSIRRIISRGRKLSC